MKNSGVVKSDAAQHAVWATIYCWNTRPIWLEEWGIFLI